MNSAELKQAICNQILGTTFKDVERAMESVLKERQLTPAQEEEMELRQAAPHKFEPDFDPDFEFRVNKKATTAKKTGSGYRTLTREEVAELLAASEAPFIPPEPLYPPVDYPTYSREEVELLVREHYEYLEYEKKRKEEREWVSQKTTEYEVKTESTTKRSKSSKA